MLDHLRKIARRSKTWLKFQEINGEGWLRAHERRTMQRKILKTAPVRTGSTGPKEVRVLTWKRDWMNVIWALKSFYRVSGVDYPLYIHDGGLEPRQAEALLSHFPNATLITRASADRDVERIFTERGLVRCMAARHQSPLMLKLFDFFLLSNASHLVSIDSDIVFFKKPVELLAPPEQCTKNLYNRDQAYAYAMEPEEFEREFAIRPAPLINAGLSMISRRSMDFDKIEEWLRHPKLVGSGWLIEQTLHAMCSTVHGVELLPETYAVSTTAGLRPDLVCKHYPGYFRPLLYSEGMRHFMTQMPL